MSRRSARSAAISRRRLSSIAGGLILLAGSVYGALFAAETFWAYPPCCGAVWPNPNPVQAERALTAADPVGRNAAAQADTARAVLRARPTDATAWMRLAYADAIANGGLTAEGREALRNSYTMTAYGGPRAAWRSAFALQYWVDLDTDLRERAAAEFKVFRNDGARFWVRRGELATVTSAQGQGVAVAHGLLKADEFAAPAREPAIRR